MHLCQQCIQRQMIKHEYELAQNFLSTRLSPQREEDVVGPASSPYDNQAISLRHYYQNEHTLPLADLCTKLQSNLQQGLSEQIARKRLVSEGPNFVSSQWRRPKWLKCLLELVNPFAIILWMAAILSLLIYYLQLQDISFMIIAWVMAATNIINAFICYSFQDRQEEDEGIAHMLSTTVPVLRDGLFRVVSADTVVRGDIIQIIAGQRVPADVRIVQSDHLVIDNDTIIKGNTSKQIRIGADNSRNILLSEDMAFSQTYCKQGRGLGIVIQTGERTVYATNYRQLLKRKKKKQTIYQQIRLMMKTVSVVTLVLLVVTVSCLIFLKFNIFQAQLVSCGLLMAAASPSLLVIIFISLVITVKRLFKRNILVKSLNDIVTLGRTTCICANKQRGMTKGTSKVASLLYDMKEIAAQDVATINAQQPQNLSVKTLIETAMAHNTARLDPHPGLLRDGRHRYIGRPYDVALSNFLLNLDNQFHPAQDRFIRNEEIRLCSVLVLIQKKQDDRCCVHMKGSFKDVWQGCQRILIEGNQRYILQSDQRTIVQGISRCQNRGESVVAYARCQLALQIFSDFPQLTTQYLERMYLYKQFTLIGAISYIDPCLAEIPKAIQTCKIAGVKMVIFSMSSLQATFAFLKGIEMIDPQEDIDCDVQTVSQVVTFAGSRVAIISNDFLQKVPEDSSWNEKTKELQYLCRRKQVVFGNIRPYNKPKVVRALQSIGHVVAATADGYWTATSRNSDLGISMGISGSDLQKESSRVVILDDDMSSVVKGLEEGRKAIENIRKIIQYQLVSSFAEMVPFLASAILQIPFPLSLPLMLALSLGTNVYASISLAFEQPEIDIMTNFQERKIFTYKLLARSYGLYGVMESMGGFFAYNIIMNCYGFPFYIQIGILAVDAYIPNEGIVFNHYLGRPDTTFRLNASFLGYNSSEGGSTFYSGDCDQSRFKADGYFPNWFTTSNSNVDLRAVYVECCENAVQNYYCPQFVWPLYEDVLHTISPVSGHEVAFTTEAVLYAQSGYFSTVVIMQMSNMLACKSKRMSIIYAVPKIHNLGSVVISVVLLVGLLYADPINSAFGGRPLPFFLLVAPGCAFSVVFLLIEEIRKAYDMLH